MGPTLCEAVAPCVLPSVEPLTETSAYAHLLNILTLGLRVCGVLALH